MIEPVGPLDDILRRAMARDAEHRQTCTATWCDACGRHACIDCRSVRVDDRERACRACQIARALTRARVPRRYLDADLADDAMMRARVRSLRARELAVSATTTRTVVLHGPIGTGKSTLAIAMLRAHVARQIDAGRRPDVLVVSAIDLELARAQHRLGSGSEAQLVAAARRSAILVIDDLGAESPRGTDVIASVVHARHDGERPMWITTGLTAAEIGVRYSAGVERRLYEGATIIHCAARPTA